MGHYALPLREAHDIQDTDHGLDSYGTSHFRAPQRCNAPRRLRKPRGLNEQPVWPKLPDDAIHTPYEVAAQRAADAARGQLDYVQAAAREARAVHAHGAKLIDQNGRALIGQFPRKRTAQKGGLA
jgi:hypothetical protein